MKRPTPLSPGARVALIAPSGPVPEDRLEPAAESVRALGLEPVVYESCRARHGYLAGEDSLRAQDLNRAFADPSIQGILCIRGGYGAQRFLHQVHWEKIARTPKFFAGYSDVTALHTALTQRCGFCTYHTPMPSTEWYKGLDGFTMASLRGVLFGEQVPLENPPGVPLQTLAPGTAEGELTGGNLSLVSSSLGTPWEIDTRGKILFLEDVDEAPYRVDGMLTHLRNGGKLQDCAGIVLGHWEKCGVPEGKDSLTLEQIFRELLAPLGKPVLMGLACGHCLPTLSLELGGRCRLDASARTLTMLP